MPAPIVLKRSCTGSVTENLSKRRTFSCPRELVAMTAYGESGH